MKRRTERIGFVGVYVFVLGCLVLILSPTLKTKVLFGVCRFWYKHSPVAKSLPMRFAPPDPYVPVWTTLEPGVRMLLDPNDSIGQNLLLHGTWEPETWHDLEPYVPVGGTFIDVGASIGWYSLKAAKAVGPTGRVIAVEPDRDALVNLRDNIHANGADSVIRVEPVACSDAETTLMFYAVERGNQVRSSLSERNASDGGPISASYKVRARRLDDIANEEHLTRVDVIKVDVEGAEFLVLKGSRNIISRYKPVISLELSIDGLKAMGSSIQEVLAFMFAHGYRPRQHTHEETVIFTPTN